MSTVRGLDMFVANAITSAADSVLQSEADSINSGF